jgi:hypothetical protein
LTLITLGLEECAAMVDKYTSSKTKASLKRQYLRLQADFAELRFHGESRPPV